MPAPPVVTLDLGNRAVVVTLYMGKRAPVLGLTAPPAPVLVMARP